MAKVTNHGRNPRILAGVFIPGGGTREVAGWPEARKGPVVSRLLDSGVISDGQPKGEVAAPKMAAPSEDAEKERLIAALAALGISKTKRSSVESLQKTLDEAQEE